jgi:hypothetical protein
LLVKLWDYIKREGILKDNPSIPIGFSNVSGSTRKRQQKILDPGSVVWYISQAFIATCSACCLLHAGSLFGLVFNLEDGGNMFLRNVC